MTSPTAPVFDLMSATAAANTRVSAANLRQDPYLTATVGGSSYDILSGSVTVNVGANVALTVAGGSTLSTQNLTKISTDSGATLAQDATVTVGNGQTAGVATAQARSRWSSTT